MMKKEGGRPRNEGQMEGFRRVLGEGLLFDMEHAPTMWVNLGGRYLKKIKDIMN